ncbi:hypothetical protein [Deinococcus hopiensis]|uniref:Uncharacterized protein n=1 Tax=Deinococcus hopiensis KR-140 TaxID=695939 RepID=A0A1W1UWR5_9DEIO|nr:hypothetical protein [Deinococcus hopiensis]SMB85605.1 hypothetical protein SAMN00790413_03469 [Deinococcus hopiensis KR-140]
MFKKQLRAAFVEGPPFAIAGGTLVSIAAGNWHFLEYAMLLLGFAFIVLCLQPHYCQLRLRVKYAHLNRLTYLKNSSKDCQ